MRLLLLGWAALALTVALLPGLSAENGWAVLAAAQNRPVLIHPRDWQVTLGLDSADAVHAQLRQWLAGAGSFARGDELRPEVRAR